MGAKPVLALNVAMLPEGQEFRPLLTQIMRGGSETMAKAGVVVAGGHTIKDKEPKFGYAVMGLVHPDKILDNSMAREGDAIILTKPLGTGIISTAIKRDMCEPAVMQEVTDAMSALNGPAAEVMLEVGVSTATDVTGFGLIGHLSEVMAASNVKCKLHSKAIPFFTDAARLAGLGVVPGGTKGNYNSYAPGVTYAQGVTETEIMLLNDAQTSGGLMMFVPQQRRQALQEALLARGEMAVYIGDVLPKGEQQERMIMVIQ
jgi:selenium donor protein